ncbi:hypothetical protein NC652_011038 [Populus alba x Populus x berolinensis]|nr:hypothetical protein NC652_011038 [Populus alba x Populus x berolinensis]
MVFLYHCPLIIYFDGKVVLYYFNFLREFIKSFIVNNHLKFPFWLCASFQHLSKYTHMITYLSSIIVI